MRFHQPLVDLACQVAEYQTPSLCEHSGRISRILRASYQKVAVLDRVIIFERNLDEDNDAARRTPPHRAQPLALENS